MLALLLEAVKAAGIKLSVDIVSDLRDVMVSALDVSAAEARRDIAKAAGHDAALIDILGGNVQEREQRFLNMLARLEKEYAVSLGGTLPGFLAIIGVKV